VWNRLDLWGHVGSVHVSVDAATPETYRKLRPGGQLAQLMPNLYFLGHLRRLQAFDAFQLVFTVRQENYTEMPDFARLARRVGATGVIFRRSCNRGQLGDDASRAIDITDPRHADHEQFRRILEDPVLKAPDVDTGDLKVEPKGSTASRAQGSGSTPDPVAKG
jgi:MoaA/NifB/PqqE/SkfB family radical SAM enzyme